MGPQAPTLRRYLSARVFVPCFKRPCWANSCFRQMISILESYSGSSVSTMSLWRRGGLKVAVMFALSLVVSCHEHGFLMPNPAELGWKPVPLKQRVVDYRLPLMNGSLPTFLRGTLYRGAPGQWPDGWWLDSLITLNSFTFTGDGRVLFNMQWNKDQVYNHTLNKHDRTAAPSAAPIPHPANSSFPTGVYFQKINGSILGSTGVSNMNAFDAETLLPEEMPFRYDDDLGAPFLAPTHTQTVDGSVLHHVAYGVQGSPLADRGYLVTEVPPGSRTRRVVAKFSRPREASWQGKPSYSHMSLATPRFYIMLEARCYYPATVTPVGRVDWTHWHWNPWKKTHLRVVERETGKATLYPLQHNVFSIHHINAYEDGDTLVVDTIRLFPSFVPCGAAFRLLTMNHTVNDWKSVSRDRVQSQPLRLRVPLRQPGATVVPEKIGHASNGMEFPTIRYEELNGRKYTYAYGNWARTKESAYYDALGKLNVDTGGVVMWHRPDQYPGEPIFVADPEGTAEDDGVIMTNVLDVKQNCTYLLLLNTTTMTEQARLGPTPHVIPHGYHGRFFASP